MRPAGWPWLVRDRRAIGIAAIDLVLIAAVLVYGLVTHRADPITRPGYALLTILPYWIGWTAVAPALGAYSRRALRDVRVGVAGVCLWWGIAALIGAGLRGTGFFPGNAPPIFILVTAGVGLVVLLPWRAVVSWV